MLTVHHLGISQSDRIVWLCEELGLDYRLERYDRDPVTMLAPPAYKSLHPSGTAPVIVDGDVVLAESTAIVDYIVARHGGERLTLTSDDPSFAGYLYWYHYANGSLLPAFAMMTGQGAMSDIMRIRVERGLKVLDDHLAQGHAWLAGETFTVADIMIMFPLTTMRQFVQVDLAPYSNIRAYLKRVGARPAFQKAMSKADPGHEIALD